VSLTEFDKNFLHWLLRLLFLDHFLQFFNVVLTHFFAHFSCISLGVLYVVLIMCFGFRKRFPLLFLCSKLFDKKAKSVAFSFLGTLICLLSSCYLIPIRNQLTSKCVEECLFYGKAKTNAEKPDLTRKTYWSPTCNFNGHSNKILFRSLLQRLPEKNMKAIEIPKTNSNIETALVKVFSSVLLSLRRLNCPVLKTKVSKTQMNSN